jgi:hypothetical protein
VEVIDGGGLRAAKVGDRGEAAAAFGPFRHTLDTMIALCRYPVSTGTPIPLLA